MTKALIIQQASGDYREMLRLTHARHSKYAMRHQIDFWSILGSVQDNRHPYWDKIALIIEALQMPYDMVVWLDADTLICSAADDVRTACSEFNCIGMCRYPLPWQEQPWHFNAGVIFTRNCALARKFFAEVWELGPTEHPWQDQARIMESATRIPEAIQPIGSSNGHRCGEPSWSGQPFRRNLILSRSDAPSDPARPNIAKRLGVRVALYRSGPMERC
jgi:hypothetical protein